MKKIPTVFVRDMATRKVTPEVTPGCEWVAAGEGEATRKWDGTCCLVRDGKLYKRYDAKRGKAPPEGFEPAQEPDPITGHWPGWVPVGDGPEDKHHRGFQPEALADGTYELIGPKINGNPEGWPTHCLIQHGAANGHVALEMGSAPRAFDAVRDWLSTRSIEGVVWHHPDGRMAKVKRKDFGFKWPLK